MTLRELAARWRALADCRASCLSLAKLATAIADEHDALRAELDALKAPADNTCECGKPITRPGALYCSGTCAQSGPSGMIKRDVVDNLATQAEKAQAMPAWAREAASTTHITGFTESEPAGPKVEVGRWSRCVAAHGHDGHHVFSSCDHPAARGGDSRCTAYMAEPRSPTNAELLTLDERHTEAQRAIAEAVAELRSALSPLRPDTSTAGSIKRALAALEKVHSGG